MHYVPRFTSTFQGFDVNDRRPDLGVQARCALAVAGLALGDIARALRIEGGIDKVLDVAVPPGPRSVGAPGFSNDEIPHTMVLSPGVQA